MKISAIMTCDPKWVTPAARLDDALETLDRGVFRHLPVLEDGRLVGILSDRDLLTATGWLSSRVHALRGPGMKERVRSRVSEVMHREVLTIGPAATLREAVVEFLDRRISCLPVLDGERLVGILTKEDLLWAYTNVCEQGVVPEHVGATVGESMSAKLVTIDFTMTLEKAILTTATADVDELPVLQQGLLLGMVSDRDLRRAVGAGRSKDTPVDEIMTRVLVTVVPETPLLQAIRTMIEHKVGALPVCKGEELIGLLTTRDVLYRCLALFRDERGPLEES